LDFRDGFPDFLFVASLSSAALRPADGSVPG